MPYQPNNSIARLLMQRGDARAQAEYGAGQAWGQGIAQLGQIASRTIGDLAQLRADEPRRRLQEMALQENARTIEGQRMLRSLVPKFTDPATSKTNYEGLVGELRTSGYPELADDVAQKWHGEQDRALTQLQQRLDQHKTIFGKGTQLLTEFEKDPTTYPTLRPQLVELASAIHPSLAGEIPEAYDPTRVKAMLQFTMDAGKETAMRARGLADLQAARTMTDDAVKRADLYRSSLAKWLSTAKNEDDWTAVTQAAADIGVPASAIQEFGAWTPEAPTRAAEMLLTPEQRSKAAEVAPLVTGTSDEANTYRVFEAEERERLGRPLTSKERGAIWRRSRAVSTSSRRGDLDAAERKRITNAVLAKPAIWNDLTQTVKSAIAADLYEQDFTFPSTSNDDAERWRQAKIADIQKDFRESQTSAYPNVPNPNRMTDDQRDAALRSVEDSYRIQTGQDPLTDAAWQRELGRRRPPSPPTAPGLAPNLGTGQRPNTGAGQRPQADIPLSAEIPAAVSTLLKNEKPGRRYTLSDGSVWEKRDDGTVQPVE